MTYLLRTVDNSHGSKKYYDSRIEFAKAIRRYIRRGYKIVTLVRGGETILLASPKLLEKYDASDFETFAFKPFTPGYQYGIKANEWIYFTLQHTPFSEDIYRVYSL